MIKGVNRRIIEIKNTNSPYFERAVFYLRPHVLELPEEVSDAEAARFIAMIMPECERAGKYRHKYLQTALGLAAALVIIILLALF
jgi:hypothetical protein